jgi:ATP-dependent RNA helicase SUPV3L1/SUV3
VPRPTPLASRSARGHVAAVLGPTNTGKTHLAIERMLGHGSGTIGFPLRLLARENYDRMVKRKGARAVALITGEEKIVPPDPRYFVCTVESMPLDRPVDFLAVDEIQLAADWERGHVFTDRLLNARGRQETMFLGAETIRPLLRKLVPEASFVGRPRLSTLRYAGAKKITRLPPRSAVVAFSAARVYEIAELMRQQRGGTAVVLGALSPRVRNAQVGMYQAGEVDYMVATDAIGMGLNMDLDHVAFAQLEKFDGRHSRQLGAAELAQIAGRAGRHMSDGSFGTTADVGPLDEELIARIENHEFESLRQLYWRNGDLSFASLRDLIRSLEERSTAPYLWRKRDADDHQVLLALGRDAEVAKIAAGRTAVGLLWEVCQIPDFRKIMADTHARLLSQIYRFLTGPERRLPTDWTANQIARLDRAEGDIDVLTQRIAHIRTWAYVTHRADWIRDPAAWQERTRAIEDRLSDALHDRLTQRFVDRRAAVLVKRLTDTGELLAAVKADGEVLVEGLSVGRLDGLAFAPDSEADPASTRPLMAAARRVLPDEIARRVGALAAAPDGDFSLGPDGRVTWNGAAIARLCSGRSALTPAAEPLPNEFLTATLRDRLQRRVDTVVAATVDRVLEPLTRLQRAELKPTARGLAYHVVERMGLVPMSEADAQVRALDKEDRQALSRLGIRFGNRCLYLPALLKAKPTRLRALLWQVHCGRPAHAWKVPERPVAERTPGTGADDWHAIGYLPLGDLAIRADRGEALIARTRKLARQGSFQVTQALVDLAGCRANEIAPLLVALGYRAEVGPDGVSFAVEKLSRARGARRRAEPRRAHSPFAKLAELKRG